MKVLVRVTFGFMLCGLLVSTVLAQANTVDAKSLLQEKLLAIKSFQADFAQTVLDYEGVVLQQATGKISLQQPNKLYWQLFEPNESILLADGDSLWNIDPFLEQVVVYTQGTAIEDNPLILLTDPQSDKWQEYQVSQGVEALAGQFIITPIQAGGTITRLNLRFENGQLMAIQTEDGQQQTSTLIFSDMQQNQALPNKQFVFSMPDGYELDDQRAP
jgi:outer membrane lipoprotein carrier protein